MSKGKLSPKISEKEYEANLKEVSKQINEAIAITMPSKK